MYKPTGSLSSEHIIHVSPFVTDLSTMANMLTIWEVPVVRVTLEEILHLKVQRALGFMSKFMIKTMTKSLEIIHIHCIYMYTHM